MLNYELIFMMDNENYEVDVHSKKCMKWTNKLPNV